MDRLHELYTIFEKDKSERQFLDLGTQKVKDDLYSFFGEKLNPYEFKFAEEMMNAAFAEIEEKAFILGLRFSVNIISEIYKS